MLIIKAIQRRYTPIATQVGINCSIKLTFILCLFMFYTLYSCQTHPNKHSKEYDLSQIKDSGELVVLTLYGSTSYFMYRGQEMGFQYEISKQFANSLGVDIKIKVANSIDDLVHKLLSGQGDIIAYNVPITRKLKDSLLYCGEETITHQVIVQRERGKRKTIKNVTELIGKDVYVKSGKHYNRLQNLNNELGGGILIHKIDNDDITNEDLITQVAQGKISYTVADYDLAQLNQTYYPNLDIQLSISFDQRSSWAVRKECKELAAAANQWYKANVTSPAYKASCKRYFEQSKMIIHVPILSVEEGKISPYDNLFKKYSQTIEWDWRLIASLAYSESNFDPEVVSWSGAKGLMQLMPSTAQAMGVPKGKEQDPEESIKAATKYLSNIEHSFNMIKDKQERQLFVLAAYNAGIGHIYDAMALAEKYNKNKLIWKDNVEKFIQLKSNEEYFADPVCKNGYFRGYETYSFVREVMARFKLYQDKIKE